MPLLAWPSPSLLCLALSCLALPCLASLCLTLLFLFLTPSGPWRGPWRGLAVQVARERNALLEFGKPVGPWLAFKHMLADKVSLLRSRVGREAGTHACTHTGLGQLARPLPAAAIAVTCCHLLLLPSSLPLAVTCCRVLSLCASDSWHSNMMAVLLVTEINSSGVEWS